MSACVYVIQADNGEVKIGLSGTPYARLSKVKKEYGHKRGFINAYLVGYVVTSYGLAVELQVHKELEAQTTGGEWYRVNSLMALGLVAEVATMYESNSFLFAVGPADEMVSVRTVRGALGLRPVRPNKQFQPTNSRRARICG